MLGQSPTAEVLIERQSSSKQPLRPMAALPEDEAQYSDRAMHTPQTVSEQSEAPDIFGMDMPTPRQNTQQ